MEGITVSISKELTPEHYTEACDVGMTISCKPSNEWKRELLLEIIKDLEGWKVKDVE